jgi:GMP synthase-like glutamine amidotransferase
MRILVFQHVAVEHPGVFRQFWHDNGDTLHTVELDAGQSIPDFNGFDLLVVMGGPMDVWQEDRYPWLRSEKAAIRNWVMELARPFIGICLGHQLLAAALGGTVELMGRPEIGVSAVDLTEAGRRDALFSGFESPVETFQWHGAEITQPPDGAEILAQNSACAVQAFRWGAHAYGLQYHVEITASTVGEWSNIAEYRSGLERTLGPHAIPDLEQAVKRRLDRFAASARHLNDNLASIIRARSLSMLRRKRFSA